MDKGVSPSRAPAGGRKLIEWGPGMPGLGGRQWVAVAGFLAALLGLLLPWADAGGRNAWAFQDGARFRLEDWFDSGLIDGPVVAALGLGGLLLMLGQGVGGPNLHRYEAAARAVAAAVTLVALVETQYLLSLDGVGLGPGLLALLAGSLAAAGVLIIQPALARRQANQGVRT